MDYLLTTSINNYACNLQVRKWQFNVRHYVFMQEAMHEHINNLIKEAEKEHQAHEFLKSHPECKTLSSLWATIHRIMDHKPEHDDTRNQEHML